MVKTLLALLLAAGARSSDKWPPAEMPLQLAVRTPQDLIFKNVAERQYLIFNLLAAGKVAWDQGDFATAAARWETLLGVPGLDPEIDKAVRPLAEEARKQAGKPGALPPRVEPPQEKPTAEPRQRKREAPAAVTVEGTVSGGGAAGPGGAVITLKRVDGQMPRAEPVKKVIVQRGKVFMPRVLAISAGSSVVFRNEDTINHDVFSLSPRFDTGIYKAGDEKEEVFDKPGVVQLLCNIHAEMIGYVVVADTPYVTTADATGAFSFKGIPPGQYEVEAWHENSSKTSKQQLAVTKDGAKIALTVGSDRQPPAFPPNKYGQKRQTQLPY